MQKGDAAFRNDAKAAAKHVLGLGREAGDQIGAERDVGTELASAACRGDRLGAAVAPLHALQDQIVARLQRQMQMRHQPGLVAERVPEIAVDLARIERRKPQTRQLGKNGEQLPDHPAEARSAGQVGAVSGHVDAGQHDLAIAGGEERTRLGDDLLERHRAARPARIGDYAKGAAMVAALLHLQIRPRPKPPLTLPLSP